MKQNLAYGKRSTFVTASTSSVGRFVSATTGGLATLALDAVALKVVGVIEYFENSRSTAAVNELGDATALYIPIGTSVTVAGNGCNVTVLAGGAITEGQRVTIDTTGRAIVSLTPSAVSTTDVGTCKKTVTAINQWTEIELDIKN
jgi:uncharacterized protein with ACT and thioredoxin-like domain